MGGMIKVTFEQYIKTIIIRSDGKRRNTLGCLDQYMCNVLRL